MDRAAFPTLARYLDRLPLGCDSYPGCLTKVALVRHALRDRPVSIALGAIPPALADLIRDPPPVSLWIPEVHFKAAMLVMKDIHFPGEAGRGPFRRWTHDLASRMFHTPLYRALFFVISPARMLRGMNVRWEKFHRGGVETRLLAATERSGTLRVTYPDFLYCEYGLLGLSTSVLAAIEAAGGLRVTVDVTAISNGEAEIKIGWEG